MYSVYSRLVVGGEWVEGRSNVVTNWGRIRRGGEDGNKWIRRSRKSSWDGE
jgi:hypothetical protein